MEAGEAGREEKKKQSFGLALLIHVLLIILLFLPLLTYPDPPPGQEGILVSFGQPDEGSNEQPTAHASLPENPVSTEEVENQEAGQQPDPSLDGVIEEEVVKTEKPDPAVVAARQKALEEEKKRVAEEKARKAAEEEAKKKKAEEARRLEEQKSQFGQLFGSGSGNNENSGQAGDPEGDPDANALDGLSKGSGRVGGGLSNRGLLFEPRVTDHSQKTGRVVIRVCVDESGNVTSAEYTQKGSTTTDGDLKRKAVEGARKYRFSSSEIREQCGTITFDFKLQ